MTENPSTIWANRVNLAGLYSSKPLKMKFNEFLEEWYDKSGNFSVKKPGTEATFGFVSFASKDKREVEKWTEGAVAVLKILRDFTGGTK